VSELTGFPEIMDGRVKTLHPGVHGGLLSIRDDTEHRLAMQAHEIAEIDLAVVNLYPFEQTVAGGADAATIVENIDIGGPAMIRASAKNHAYVTAVTDPGDYGRVLEALRKPMTDAFRLRCARNWRRSPLPGPRPMTQRFPDGLPPNLRWKHRGTVPLAAGCMRSCATAKTRTRLLRSTPMASNRPGVARDTAAGQAAVLQQHQ
jgi:hypothetical protein